MRKIFHHTPLTLTLTLALCLLAGVGWGADWYVRPLSGAYGTENGQTYDTAWAGFNSIVWGGDGVVAGDTLWVCGLHDGNDDIEQDTGENEVLGIQASGTVGSPIVIRGDYATDPGIIDAAVDLSGEAADWTEESTNKWYRVTNRSSDMFRGAIRLDDGNATKWGRWQDDVASLTSLGDFTETGSPRRLYIYCTENPSSYFAGGVFVTVENIKAGVVVDNREHITIKNLTIKNIYSNSQYFERHFGGIELRDSDNCIVSNNTIENTGEGIISITSYQTDSIDILDNTVTGFLTYYGGTGISVFSPNTMIRGNTVNGTLLSYSQEYDGVGIAIYRYTGSNKCDGTPLPPVNSSVENNIVFGTEKGIWIIDNTSDTSGPLNINISVIENEVYDISPGTGDTDGIGIGGAGQGWANRWYNFTVLRNNIDGAGNTGIHFANNSGENSTCAYNIVQNVEAHGAGIRVKNGVNLFNNIIYNSSGPGVQKSTDGDAGAPLSTIKNNIVHTATTGYTAENTNFTASHNLVFNSTTAYDADFSQTDGVTSDPLFTSAATSDFTLTASSPAIDTGENLGDDYDIGFAGLDQDEHGSGWEIGAYVYEVEAGTGLLAPVLRDVMQSPMQVVVQ